jgi:4-amino-4-deoxy-L-arabinose transferase-like glycosyltransferase
MKIKLSYIILILILILSFYFRAYHVDYPVTGYHNWKETHYLTEARNFAEDGFFEHGFFIPEWDYPNLKDDPSGAHTDSFPTMSIVIGSFFMIFGPSLLIARLVSVLFSLGSIIFIYLIIKLLFKREDFALICALILAINPLNIFFGRQVQLLGPALLLCLMGLYFYIKWQKNSSWKNTILFTFPMMLGILTKYSFILLAVPIIFTYPYKKLKDKSYLLKHIFILFMGILAYIWFKYSSKVSQTISSQFEVVEFNVLFQSSFWKIMLAFIKDNITILGLIFFILGLVLFFFLVKIKRKSFRFKFIFSYFIGSLIWFIFMSQKLQGHNYHQYPLLPLYVFFISFFILTISKFLAKILKKKKLKWIFVFIFIILLMNPSISAKNRMFDTQFPGLDLAGEYIKENKIEGDRVMHSSHQAYGLLWHGDLKGTGGIPKSIEDIKFVEENLNGSWIFIYNWDFSIFSEERFNYIKQNYRLVQFGFNINADQLIPVYFLFRKGGSFNDMQFNAILDEKVNSGNLLEREYEYTFGKRKLQYINLE